MAKQYIKSGMRPIGELFTFEIGGERWKVVLAEGHDDVSPECGLSIDRIHSVADMSTRELIISNELIEHRDFSYELGSQIAGIIDACAIRAKIAAKKARKHG